MHSLLKRQIAKCFPDADLIPENCRLFIDSVNSAYEEMDEDRKKIKRSLDLSSQEVLQSDAEMRALFSAMNDLVIVLDREGRHIKIVDANPDLLYRPVDEQIGKTLHEILGPEKADYFVSKINQVLATNARATVEYMLPIGEKEVWFEATISPLSKDTVIWVAKDISKRKHAQQTLTESEERYRGLFENVNDLIQVVAMDGRILFANRAWQQTLGYDEKEIAHLSLFDIIHPESRDHCLELFRRMKLGEQLGVVEAKFVSKDGRSIRVEGTSHCKVVDGKPVLSYGIFRDVTYEKKYQENLERSFSLLHATLESTADAILVISNEGSIVNFNQKLLDLWRIPRHVMDSDSLKWSLKHILRQLEDPRAFLAKLEKLEADPDAESLDILACKDGRIIERYVMPQKLGGKAVGRVISFRDITRRTQAEKRIREQAALLDRAQDAIYVNDLGGTISFWNNGAANIYGWIREDALGKNAGTLLHKQSSEFSDVLTSIRERGEWNGELNQVAKDGRELIVQSRCSLVRDDRGNPQSILVINTDITEKKKLEAQFLRAQRLESIGTLAGGIAHDLNNILAPILMAVPILRSMFNDPRSNRILDNVEISATRGASVVGQVLSFARGGDGERTVVQAKHILKDIDRIVRNTFPRSIQVKTEIAEDLWLLNCDPTQLYQVLMNLCVNARDAMPEGGVLQIGAETIVIDEQYAKMHIDAEPGFYLVFTVSDTGTGIPPHVLEKIFEPFFTTKEVGKGTGLGLSTVIGIVKGHQGFVNVYSEVGKGARFKVYFPALHDGKTDSVQDKQLQIPEGHGELVLVVDDEEVIRDMQRTTLEAHGYRVLTACDGAEAVAVFAQAKEEIDVVITDIMMPFMDGKATVRALRRINGDTKFILTSGLLGNGQISDLASLDSIMFLQKPFTTEKFLMTVHAASNSNKELAT